MPKLKSSRLALRDLACDEVDAPAPAPLSPARQRLRELQDARAAADAENAERQEQLSRLEQLAQSASAIESELAALDSTERQAFDEWARGDTSLPAPVADTAKRADIHRRLAEAKAKADAGQRGAVEMRSRLNEVAGRINAADKEIAASIPVSCSTNFKHRYSRMFEQRESPC